MVLHEGGGNCLKYLKMEWNRKEGRENKVFKKGGGWVKGWVSKKREALEPSYELRPLKSRTKG